jgi:uncharacterized HAD superfamily protein
MKIALDFDGTLADTQSVICEMMNFKHGTHYTPNDVTSWTFWADRGLDKDFWEAYDFLDRTHARRMIRPVSPFAAATMKWIAGLGHEVEVVTSNNAIAAKDMQSWLFGHGLDFPVRCIGRVSAEEKIALGYQMFIDDSPDLATAIAKSDLDVRLLMIAQPWNKHIASANVYRLNDWRRAASVLSDDLGWV